ncbi:hypothetical protein [Hymenobacter tenuis]
MQNKKGYSWWQLSLLLTVALLYLHTECSEPLLFMVQLPLAGALGLVYGWARIYSPATARRLWPVAAAVGVASLASLLGMPPIYAWQRDQTQRHAVAYVHHLEQYYQAHGSYPHQAAQLVPAYLPHLPSTGQGLLFKRPFRYQLASSRKPGATSAPGFRLSYYAGAAVDASYWSETKQWESED